MPPKRGKRAAKEAASEAPAAKKAAKAAPAPKKAAKEEEKAAESSENGGVIITIEHCKSWHVSLTQLNICAF